MTKPTIVIVGPNASNEDAYSVRALVFYLKQHLGYKIEMYRSSYDVKRESIGLKKLVASGHIMCFFVLQEQYSNDCLNTIQIIRGLISDKVPIMFLECYRYFEPPHIDVSILNIVASSNEVALFRKMDELRSGWKIKDVPLDHFGVRTRKELQFFCGNLVRAYNSSNVNEEYSLAPITEEQKLVSESLRMRLLPSLCFTDEFDKVVIGKSHDSEDERMWGDKKTDHATYLSELEKVRCMDQEGREDFYHNLLKSIGCRPAEGGGIIKYDVSMGGCNKGFAIEPVTLQTAISSGHGLHAMALQYLKFQLEHVAMLKMGNSEPTPVEDVCGQIITGIIIKEIKGFRSPFLMLFRKSYNDPESLKRVGEYIIGAGDWIPVFTDGSPVVP